METLNKLSVIRLIKRAVKTNKCPSTEQLMTLATALGYKNAHKFLKSASIKTLTAVKNTIAIVNGEAPKTVSDGKGTMFGLVGDDSEIASEKQDKIYSAKPVEPTTSEQKDIKERNANEDKHPDTSDRKVDTSAVEEPLKPKPEFKSILDRGKKDPVEKRTASKKVADIFTQVTVPLQAYEVTALEDLLAANPDGDHVDILSYIINSAKAKATGSKKTAEYDDEYPYKPSPTKGIEKVSFEIATGDIPYETVLKAMQKVLNKAYPMMEDIVTEAFQGGAVLSLASKKTAMIVDLIDDTTKQKLWQGDLEEFFRDNFDWFKDNPQESAQIRRDLAEKGEAMMGGGATPVTILKKVSSVPKKSTEVKEEPSAPVEVKSSCVKESTEKKENSKKFADVQPGEVVQIEDPALGPRTITIDTTAQAPEGKQALVGKDEAGQTVVIPEGTEISQKVDTSETPITPITPIAAKETKTANSDQEPQKKEASVNKGGDTYVVNIGQNKSN